MKKTLFSFIVSIIAFFGIFICTPNNNSVNASELSTNAAVEKQWISSYTKAFTSYPPDYYLHSYGKFKGWLHREDAYTIGTQWYGVYEGYVYYPVNVVH